MQQAEFSPEEGQVEFGLDNRRKIKDILDRILDEMGDAHTLDGMFVPYANVVYRLLNDEDINQQIKDEAADFAAELEEFGDE